MNTDLIPTQQQPQQMTASAAGLDVSILAGQVAPSTMAMYRRDATAYARFAGSREAAYDPSTLAQWRTHLAQSTTMSPNTINRMMSAVRRVVSEAAQQGHVAGAVADGFDRIPGVKVKAMKDRTKPNARVRITRSDMRKICEAPNLETLTGIRDAALLATLASSGLRVDEAASLTMGQIVEKANGKGRQGFVLMVMGKNETEPGERPLSVEAYDKIMTWIDQRPFVSQFIFTSFQGRSDRPVDRPMTAVAVWKAIRKYATQVGLVDVKPHDFRRFVGTQLARKDIRLAQKALGHKRIDTTARHYVLDDLESGLTDDLF